MFPYETVLSIKRAVCAIGYLKSSPAAYQADPTGSHLRLHGTGFLVRENVVLTARHVITQLQDEMENNLVPKDRAVLVFDRPEGTTATQFLVHFARAGWTMAPTKDLGIVAFDPPTPDWADKFPPVSFSHRVPAALGLEVGAFGFPQGSLGVEKVDDTGTVRVYRFGPVLQRGYISAVAPFDGAPIAERYLLDMATSKGMSGGPLFEPYKGTVIGLHEKGLGAETAFAIPLTRSRVEAFVSAYLRMGESTPVTLEMPPAEVDPTWQ